MIKEEKIKEAYGENYNPHNIDENGWMKYSLWMHFFKKVDADYDEFDNRNMVVRPNSLTGIENNNGWIKIESEEDLPKNNGSYFTKTNYCKETIERYYPIFTKSKSIEDERKWWLENITHYQPIVKPNNPLY